MRYPNYPNWCSELFLSESKLNWLPINLNLNEMRTDKNKKFKLTVKMSSKKERLILLMKANFNGTWNWILPKKRTVSWTFWRSSSHTQKSSLGTIRLPRLISNSIVKMEALLGKKWGYLVAPWKRRWKMWTKLGGLTRETHNLLPWSNHRPKKVRMVSQKSSCHWRNKADLKCSELVKWRDNRIKRGRFSRKIRTLNSLKM